MSAHQAAPSGACRLTTWNLWWPTVGSERARRVLAHLDDQHADVIVETETNEDLRGPHANGYLITGGDDWGYERQAGRRKVAMWSRNPWRDVDRDPDPRMPPGRFVSATTNTPAGELKIIGVCIPWRDAHVRTGRRDAEAWSEHLSYLEVLKSLVADQQSPVVIAGDFNQRMPRFRQPARLYDALMTTLDGLEVATAGRIDDSLLIDHVAHSPGIESAVDCVLPAEDSDGRLSDHKGVTVTLTARM